MCPRGNTVLNIATPYIRSAFRRKNHGHKGSNRLDFQQPKLSGSHTRTRSSSSTLLQHRRHPAEIIPNNQHPKHQPRHLLLGEHSSNHNPLGSNLQDGRRDPCRKILEQNAFRRQKNNPKSNAKWWKTTHQYWT